MNKPEYYKKYYATHKAEIRQRCKRWRENNPQRTLDLNRESSKRRRRSYKEKVFQKLGNRCANSSCCWLNIDGSRGCTDSRCLQIDHVNSDGFKDHYGRYSCHGVRYFKKILNDTGNQFQLLCANCNWIKRVEKQESSHIVL